MISDKDYLRDIPVLRRLKKCPFCGSNAVMLQSPIYKVFAIECQNEDCGADVYFYGSEFKPDLLAEKWNRRTEK